VNSYFARFDLTQLAWKLFRVCGSRAVVNRAKSLRRRCPISRDIETLEERSLLTSSGADIIALSGFHSAVVSVAPIDMTAAVPADSSTSNTGTQHPAIVPNVAGLEIQTPAANPSQIAPQLNGISVNPQVVRTPEETANIANLENAAYLDVVALQTKPPIPNAAEVQADLDAIYLQLVPLLVGSDSSPIATESDIANSLSALQLPNGAIRISQFPAGYGSSEPYYMADVYFTGTALYWALDAPPTANVDLLAITKNWLVWCLANADSNRMLQRYNYYADGTVAANAIAPDAEDSNSAMILAVMAKYIKLGGTTDFIDTPETKAKLELIAKVMTDLQQPNGLTWGSVGYPISDTEDQSEVFAGFRAMSDIEANVFHDLGKARDFAIAASRVQTGILNLLYNQDPDSKLFDWALNTHSHLSSNWYPDTISQVWPILYGVVSPSSDIAQSVLTQIQDVWSGNNDPRLNWQDRLDASSVAMAFWMGGYSSLVQTALVTIAQTPYPLNGYPLYVTTTADTGFTLSLVGVNENQAPVTYFQQPVVAGISTTHGPFEGATTLTIAGSDLGDAYAVYFGSTPATILSNTNSQLTVVSPAGSFGQVDISVLTKGGISDLSAADQVTYDVIPTLTGLTPNLGPSTGGTTVTLTGTNLSNATAVLFGNIAVTNFISKSDTQIVVLSPISTAGAVDVRIMVGSSTSAITSADNFTYQVIHVNEAPTNITLSSTSIAENNLANATVGTLSATDPDAGNTFTFSLVDGLGSADNGSFTLAGNVVNLKPVADFETKASYSILVQVADQGGLTFQKQLTINVMDVNEPPTITAIGTQTILEDGSTGALLFTVGDPETSASSLVVQATSSNPGSILDGNLMLSGAGSIRSLVATPIANGNGTTIITVTVSDGTLSTSQQFQITVTAVDDPPVITTSPMPLTYHVKARKIVTVDSTATITDVDTPTLSFGAAVLSVSGQGSKDQLSIQKQGGVSIKGKSVRVNSIVVGELAGGQKGGPLTVRFNSAATQSTVQSVLHAIGFKSTDKAVGHRTLQIEISNIGGANTNSATKQIDVVP
jgi:hypothetical protein